MFLQIGPDGASEEDWGVNYRALNDLFQISQKRGGIYTYEITIQMVEIYNEQVRDLLTSGGSQKRYPSSIFCHILRTHASKLDQMVHEIHLFFLQQNLYG